VSPLEDDESPAKRTRGKCLTKPLSRGSAIPVKIKTPKSVSKKDELPANNSIMAQSKSTNLRSKNKALPAGTSTATGAQQKKPRPKKSGVSAAATALKSKEEKKQSKSNLVSRK
jgi:hypothetical protein